MLSALPAPNGSGRSNNYQQLLLTRDYADKYDAKIDGQIGNKMTAFLRFSQRKDNQFYQPTIAGPSGGDGNAYEFAWNGTVWSASTLGGGSGYLYGFHLGAGRNDGAIRLYGASFNRGVYEYTWGP